MIGLIIGTTLWVLGAISCKKSSKRYRVGFWEYIEEQAAPNTTIFIIGVAVTTVALFYLLIFNANNL